MKLSFIEKFKNKKYKKKKKQTNKISEKIKNFILMIKKITSQKIIV